jgi:CRP/FNR family transcriptional regulator, cyclic AMP receptor protein
MEPAFLSDQIDAHRLLVQVSAGRATAGFKNHQTIFAQGDEANFVFFVQDGSVKLTRVLNNGSEKIIGMAQQGQFFGESCLHDVPLRLASATAIGDCRITSVTKKAMLSTIQGQPKLAKMFVDYLSDHNSWVKKDLLGHLLKPAEAAEIQDGRLAIPHHHHQDAPTDMGWSGASPLA